MNVIVHWPGLYTTPETDCKADPEGRNGGETGLRMTLLEIINEKVWKGVW
jgi:hypothetical protein